MLYLFIYVFFTTNYYLDLQTTIKGVFREFNGIYYTLVNILVNIYDLAYRLLKNII